MFRLIGIAIKDIYRRPVKSIIFILIISTSMSALILAISMNMSVNEAVNRNIINSLPNREVYIAVNNLEGKSYEQYINIFKTIPHIEYVSKYMQEVIAGVDRDSVLSKGAYILNSGPKEFFPKAVKGRNFSEAENNAAIIPQKLHIGNGRPGSWDIIDGSTLIGKTISFTYKDKNDSSEYKYNCTIVGTYGNQVWNTKNEVYIPSNDMYGICANKGLYASKEKLLFTAVVDKQQFVDSTVKQLSSISNVTTELPDVSGNNDIGFYKVVLRVSGYMVYLLIVFILFMLYISVTNIALSNSKQIALYKAIGYNNRHIFRIVFWESTFISVAGYLLSILISVLSNTFLINPIVYDKTQLAVSISLLSVAIPLISIVPIDFMVSLFSYFKVKNIYPSILLKQD